MPGLSIHVIDVARGIPATGMRVEVWELGAAARLPLGDSSVNAAGVVALPDLLTRPMAVGRYEAIFHVADWYRGQGIALPVPPFLDTLPFCFGIADPAQHYHLPLKLTPWGCSLFRGGA
jgi:5-hydroxyisourate hydrolase